MPEVIEQPKFEAKPWIVSGCCKRCWFAKGKKCRCRCGGRNHQKGRMNQPQSEEEFKHLVEMVPLNNDVAEKVCEIIEKALHEHPEWEKLLPREKA